MRCLTLLGHAKISINGYTCPAQLSIGDAYRYPNSLITEEFRVFSHISLPTAKQHEPISWTIVRDRILPGNASRPYQI
jgi:hypothetical protein